MARPRIPNVVKQSVFSVIYASRILTAAQQNLLMKNGFGFYTKAALKESLSNLLENSEFSLSEKMHRDIVRRLRKIPKGVSLIPDAAAQVVDAEAVAVVAE